MRRLFVEHVEADVERIRALRERGDTYADRSAYERAAKLERQLLEAVVRWIARRSTCGSTRIVARIALKALA